MEVSREVLTRLSALAWVQQGARYTYVTGGLFTTPKHWHLLLDSKEDLPAPSSVSAAFPASWLLLEYEDGCLAGCPHLTGSRIFKSSTSSTTAQPRDV